MVQTVKIEATFYGRLAKILQEDKKQVELANASNIRDLLEVLCHSREDREIIFEKDGNIRKEIVILRNGRNISFLNGLETELNAGDSVALFPPTHGG